MDAHGHVAAISAPGQQLKMGKLTHLPAKGTRSPVPETPDARGSGEAHEGGWRHRAAWTPRRDPVAHRLDAALLQCFRSRPTTSNWRVAPTAMRVAGNKGSSLPQSFSSRRYV